MPRPVKVLLMLLPAALLVAVPGANAAKNYRGFLANQDGTALSSSRAGDYQGLDFRERVSGRVNYKVCISGGDANKRKCFSRETSSEGRSSINASLYFNDPDLGGPGKWKARWSIGSRTVASWSFTITKQAFDD